MLRLRLWGILHFLLLPAQEAVEALATADSVCLPSGDGKSQSSSRPVRQMHIPLLTLDEAWLAPCRFFLPSLSAQLPVRLLMECLLQPEEPHQQALLTLRLPIDRARRRRQGGRRACHFHRRLQDRRPRDLDRRVSKV